MRSISVPMRWYLGAVYACALLLVAVRFLALVAWRPSAPGHEAVLQAAAFVALVAYVCERTSGSRRK